MKRYDYDGCGPMDADDIWAPGCRNDVENTAFSLNALQIVLLDDIAAKIVDHFHQTGDLTFSVNIPDDVYLTDAEEAYLTKKVEELFC